MRNGTYAQHEPSWCVPMMRRGQVAMSRAKNVPAGEFGSPQEADLWLASLRDHPKHNFRVAHYLSAIVAQRGLALTGAVSVA